MEDPKRIEEGFGNVDSIIIVNKERNEIPEQQAEKNVMQSLVKQKTKRVATLDAFRGLTIVLMILVDDAGGAYARIDHSPWNGCTLADFVMPFFLFIVGVAIALALKRIPKVNYALRKIILRTLKLLFWGILLQGGYSHAPNDLVYGVNMKQIRWCGILQRIALVYMVVAVIETLTTKLRPTELHPNHLSIFVAYKWQWLGGFIAFVIYMVTTFSLYVPDWSFVVHHEHESEFYTVKCGMRGHLGPACNAVGYVDRAVWGINHLYNQPVWSRLKACTLSSPYAGPLRENAPSWCRAPFEPEGLLRFVFQFDDIQLRPLGRMYLRGATVQRIKPLRSLSEHLLRIIHFVFLSSVSAILSGTIGIHYGHVLIHFKSHAERLKQWISMGLVLLILAIILHFTDAIPINKQLYSFSYTCFTTGAAGIVFSGFYILIDILGVRTPFLFLEWIGMNAMLVFVLGAQGILAGFVNGWYYKEVDNNLVNWIQKHIFNDVWKSERVGTLLYVMFAEITFWAVVAGILHKLRIYWKL